MQKFKNKFRKNVNNFKIIWYIKSIIILHWGSVFMEVINNRYRVLKFIKQNKVASSYLVQDLTLQKKVMLNIINYERVPKSLIHYYIEEFIVWTNIDSSRINKVYDFGIINLIDNKKLGDIKYFFTNDYYDDNKNFRTYINAKSNEKQILDLFIKLCQGIDYMHLQGFTYGNLNFNNICIIDEHQVQDVRLKDIPTLKLEENNHAGNHYSIKNKKEENNSNKNIKGDIEALGKMLFYLCIEGCEPFSTSIFGKEGIEVKKDLSKFFLDKIQIIIRKATSDKCEYDSVRDMVKDINHMLNLKYKLDEIGDVKNLNLNTKLIGRNEEVNLVLKQYGQILPDDSKDRLLLIHGDTGIGKTKFLNSVKNLLTYNKANVFYSFSTNNMENEPIKDILRQMVDECEHEVFEKYEKDLVNFISGIHCNKNMVHDELSNIPKERLKLLNRINGFINDFTKYKPIVIVIDDIHLADDFSIEILDYLCKRQIKNKSMLIILSYCDGRHVVNKNTLQFIENIKFKENATNILLNGLDEEKTGEMLKSILGMHDVPKKFSSLIYGKSYGNPLFIEEVIKNFYYSKIIYVDKESGYWSTDYNYSDIPIPSDINQILINQVQDLDHMSYDILSITSTFLNPISIETIIFMSKYKKQEVEKRIDIILDKGILCKKIGDQGFVYDFYNKLFKDLVYGRIVVDEQQNKHRLAAEFLEKQYMNGYENYIEELIYHLQKSNQKEKVINYSLQNSNKMKKYNNYVEAIKNLKNAMNALDENNWSLKGLEIIMEIAQLYEHIGEFNEAIKYFNKLQEKSKKLGILKYQRYSLNRKAAIYLDKNEISLVEKCVNEATEIANKYEDLENYLDYRLMQARLYNMQGKYIQARDICVKSIEICTDEYKVYKGFFYNMISYVYIINNNPAKAEEALNNSMDILTKENNPEGLVRALNNMGVIYGDFYQDTEKASEFYIKIIEICKKNNLIVSEIIAINNLGEGYFYQNDYYLALNYFREVEEKSKKHTLEASLFYSYVFLSKINIKIGDYQKAYEYYTLAKRELDNYSINDRDILEYYSACGELNLEFGDLEEAEKFIKKILKFSDKDEQLIQVNSEFLLKYIELVRSEYEDIKKILKDINDMLPKANNINIRIEWLCKVAGHLYDRELYDEGKAVLEDIQKLAEDREINYLNLYVNYLEAVYSKNNCLKSLNAALDFAKKQNNKKLESKICSDIGNYYFSKGDYFNAFVYYFECCEVFMNIIKQLPEKYRKTFVNFYNIRETINRLKHIKEYYYGSNKTLKNFNKEKVEIEEIYGLLNFINYKDIMENKYFVKSVKNFYSSLYYNEVHDIKAVLNNLTSNEINNLKLILQYMLYVTMGTHGYIIQEKNNGFESLVHGSNDKNLTEEDINILNLCKSNKDTVLISNIDKYMDNTVKGLKNIKACICIPVTTKMDNGRNFDDLGNEAYDNNIVAYVYLNSDRALNNFNTKSLKKCIQLNSLIGLIIEKYKLKKIAAYDKLTSTLTRKYLEEEIEKNLDMAAENKGIFSMLMFDLDHFKNINDKYGHQTGDEVLKQVCSIVKNNIRSTDICGRYGGEEFIILLKNINLEYAKKVAEKLRIKIEEAHILGDKEKVTVSMGIVAYPEHGQWKQQLIEKVDQALYIAKEKGRNQCVVWQEDIANKVKVTNKLTGIITGNEVQNNRNVLVMVELIELLNENLSLEGKIYRSLGRIIEITESQYGTLIRVEDDKVTKGFSRKAFEEQWINNVQLNNDMIKSVIKKKHGVYNIDWDNVIQKDTITGSPDWHSVMVVPLIKNDKINGILYLSASVRAKEFGFEDFNFVDTLAKIISNMI